MMLRRRLMTMSGMEEEMKEIVTIETDTTTGNDTIEYLKTCNNGNGYELYTSETEPSTADFSSRKAQFVMFYNGKFLAFARADANGNVSSVFVGTTYEVKLFAGDRYIKTTIPY